MATATRPTPAANTASTASGTPTCRPRSPPSGSMAWTWWACTCISARAWTTATWRRSAPPWWRWWAACARPGMISGRYTPAAAPHPCLGERAAPQAQAILGPPLTLEIEPGRYLVAESGVLLAAVCATKQVGSNHFVLLDAGFNELLRPSMYGSYHAMSLLRRDGASAAGRPTVVAGPLCEAGDVFTQSGDGLVLPRDLPPAEVGDLLLIHDTGAYGATMSSNYNTRPLSAEALVEGAQARLIRRRQTVDELLALERGL